MTGIDEKLIKEIEKMGGKDIKLGPDTEGLKVLSTGSLYIDAITGVGGWPCGKVCTLVGEESSGKSTLCMLGVGKAQAAGKRVAYIDLESSFDSDRASQLGVVVDDLLLIRAKTLEDAGEILIRLVSSGLIDLIIFDSIGGASIKPLEEGEIEDSLVGRKAKIMSHLMMKLTGPLGFNKTGLVFIQQWRDSFDTYKPFVLAGGRAYRHANQMIIQLNAKTPKEVKDGTLIVTAQIRKNKVAVPFKRCEFNLYPGGRIDREEEIAAIYTDDTNLAHSHEASGETFCEALGVQRAGAWYTLPESVFGSDNKFQGSNKIVEKLKEDPSLAAKAEAEIYAKVTRGI